MCVFLGVFVRQEEGGPRRRGAGTRGLSPSSCAQQRALVPMGTGGIPGLLQSKLPSARRWGSVEPRTGGRTDATSNFFHTQPGGEKKKKKVREETPVWPRDVVSSSPCVLSGLLFFYFPRRSGRAPPRSAAELLPDSQLLRGGGGGGTLRCVMTGSGIILLGLPPLTTLV